MSSTCKSCGADIFWATTAVEGRNIPIDSQTVIGGNIQLDGLVARACAAGAGNYVSHFTTCPKAKSHRKTKTKGDTHV